MPAASVRARVQGGRWRRHRSPPRWPPSREPRSALSGHSGLAHPLGAGAARSCAESCRSLGLRLRETADEVLARADRYATGAPDLDAVELTAADQGEDTSTADAENFGGFARCQQQAL